MKVKDLLEGYESAKVHPSVQEALPPTLSVPDMDQYYEYYRFLVAIAGQPETAIPLQGPIEDGTYIAPYSKQELDHVLKLLKKMGKTPKFITHKPSKEMDNVNNKSPVRKFIDYGKD